MIHGEVMTEGEYRQLDAISQSMLRDFCKNRKKFQKDYILKEVDDEEEEEDSLPIKMGHLVHCLLLRSEEFEDRFMMSICTEPPTGLMLKFCQALSKETRNAVDLDGVVQRPFEDMAADAYRASGFKWALSRVLEGFTNKEPENYYQELIQAKIHGKVIVTSKNVDAANRVVEAIRTADHLRVFTTMEHDSEIEVFDETPITGFEVAGRAFKGIPDRMEVNHRHKYIRPWDPKIVWSVENFYEEYYIKRLGYLQVGIYDLACAHIRNIHYPGYEVLPMRYIVADTANYFAPLLYELTPADVVDALKGFMHRGRYYKGIKQLATELNWHIENNIWNMSMQNCLNKGVVLLGQFQQP